MFKWIVTIAIVCMVALMGVQFVPVYIQNHAVKKVAQEVLSSDLRSKREMTVKLEELFKFNDINKNHKDILTLQRDNKGKWVVDVKYEERRKLMYNLQLVAAFDDQITN